MREPRGRIPRMHETLTQLGVGGIFAVLVLRQVFDFVGKRKNGACDLHKLSREVADLHKWHDQRDQDGVPVWYVRRSLEDAINKLAANLATQTDVLRAMHEEIKLNAMSCKEHLRLTKMSTDRKTG